MNNIHTLVEDLNAQILAGKGMEAFEKYYADDVSMQENADAPRVGKDANRKYEVEWDMDITHKD